VKVDKTMRVFDIFYDAVGNKENNYLIICDFERLPLECLYSVLSENINYGVIQLNNFINSDGKEVNYEDVNKIYSDVDRFLDIVVSVNDSLIEEFKIIGAQYKIDSMKKNFYFNILKFFFLHQLRELSIKDNAFIVTDSNKYKEIMFEYNLAKDMEDISESELREFFKLKYNLDLDKVRSLADFVSDVNIDMVSDSGNYVNLKKNPFFSGMIDFNEILFKNFYKFHKFNADNVTSLQNLSVFGVGLEFK
jgi:hypothetical protein